MLNRISRHLKPSVDKSTAAAQRENAQHASWQRHAVQQGLGRVEEFVNAHPLACLGAALAAGTTLGWWVKRK